MKFKFTALMLAVAIAIPAMQANVKKGEQQFRTTNKVVLQTPTMKSFVMNKPVVKTGMKADVPEGYANVTITVVDNPDGTAGSGVWGDGSGYQMLLDADATAYGSIIPESGPLTQSGDVSADIYAQFEYKIPENADGALATSNVIVSGTQSLLIPAGTYDWCITNPTAGDKMWIASENGSVGGRYDDFAFESGVGYTFTISFGGQYDQVDLEIDDPTAPTIPTELAANPAATTAEITWVAGENNNTWNLRYRPYVDPLMQNRLWDLPYDDEDALNAQLDGWMIYDKDGDGANWGLGESGTSNYAFVSSSYDYNYGGSLTPDNWLVSPVCILGGTVKFDTWNYSATYPEEFEVYVFQGEDWTIDDINNGNFVQVYPHTTVTGTSATAPQAVEVDLSNYTGKGFVAIRHYGTTDQWRFYVDNFEITVPEPAVVPDWIEVDGVENPYTIEELTPETTYEVQVQGVAENGRTSDWTESVLFTTLAEGQEETKYYITGGFNNWEATNPVELTEEGYTFTAVDNGGQFDLDFKLLTAGENDWIWIGGIDENNVGCFAITEELMTSATEISLYDDGANFRLPAAGTYTVTLVREEGAKGLIEGAKIVVTKENDPVNVGVNDINAKAVAGVKYYNLAGVESNKPFDGVNIMVTTYTDGTKAAAKVIK